MLAECDALFALKPVYVLFERELSAENRKLLDAGTAACYVSPMDYFVRGDLLHLQQWRGRGAAFLFREKPASCDDPTFLGLVLHEAGHHAMAVYRKTFRYEDDYSQALARCNAGKPYNAHGDDWLRAFLHLQGRAAKAGYKPEVAGCLRVDSWLPPIGAAFSALRDEINASVGRPLIRVLGEKAPPAYQKLWDAWTLEQLTR
jgi:hypothetical protein